MASIGAGITAWLWLPTPSQWAAFIALSLGIDAAAVVLGERRLGRATMLARLALAAECGW